MTDATPPDQPAPANSIQDGLLIVSTKDATINTGPVSRPLEEEKLRLEIDHLKAKNTLELEKLNSEIKELAQAPIRARRTTLIGIAAVLATLIVAILGARISLQIQQASERQKTAEVYTSLLQDLGSTNVTARAAATLGLLKYAREDNERSPQTVAILVAQLAAEENSRV